MLLVIVSIPLMIIAVAIATVPIMIAMRKDAKVAVEQRPVFSRTRLFEVPAEDFRRAA